MAHRFKSPEIWKLSRSFCLNIYELTSTFPDSEKFGLTNQLRRASFSVASNIAEGSSRKSNKDFNRFLEIAVGSMYEIETQLLIASDLGFIRQKELDMFLGKLDSIVKMTSKFKVSLSK
ncbi:four helix bundle protein [Ulvibacterium sp.]|uniref:four helix bundle protein n=1 Tax=Ulvibacterium sp. TaxID=2665914 RepID=UPI003BACDC9C